MLRRISQKIYRMFFHRAGKEEIVDLKMMLGRVLSNQLKSIQPKSLHDAEFKVFSQWGDDGIIQYLVNNIQIDNKSFIEFGVETYEEANTRFLLLKDNWRGLIMDSSEENIQQVKSEDIYWKYELTAKTAFITSENINTLIRDAGFSGEIGLLHIDTDGNDYWIWKAINVVNPSIVIIEYNSVFGIDRAITVPYEPYFHRTKAHFSGLFFGASLLSLCDLAGTKGYSFVGCNSNGNNAYFVRKDKIGKIMALRPQEGYVLSRFKESRDKKGNLTYLTGEKRLDLIRGLNVYNTRESKIEVL